MKTLFIRPVCERDSDQVKGLALCLPTGQILEHFPKDELGRDITEMAKEFHGAEKTRWGPPLYYD